MKWLPSLLGHHYCERWIFEKKKVMVRMLYKLNLMDLFTNNLFDTNSEKLTLCKVWWGYKDIKKTMQSN